MFEYSGNIHIHSRYSDGSASPGEIAYFAKKAGLDFVIISDHFNLDALYNNEEGYRDGVLIIIGMEVNDKCNHYLAMSIKECVKNNTDNPQEVIDDVNRQNGIGVIAHPDEKGSPLFHDGQVYEWKDWSVHGFQGIEIWNFTSQWRDGISNFLKGIYLLIYPHAALTGPYKKTLKRWDHYQKSQHFVIATGGSDAHGIELKFGAFKIKILPYDVCFRCINMHILCNEKLRKQTSEDKWIVYEAISKGRAWVSYDYFKNSKGFSFIMSDSNQRWGMGNKIEYHEGITARVYTPYPAKVKLIRNGHEYSKSIGKKHIFSINDEGVYRVEAYHRHVMGYRPWIFSNSIWVTE